MDNFEIFNEKDRKDISYGACVAGSALTGVAVGRILGLQGIAAGGAAGLVIGMVTCKKVAPIIERKLMNEEPMSEGEVASVLKLIRDETGARTKAAAMGLLAQARAAVRAAGGSLGSGSLRKGSGSAEDA
ncbi:MAG: hypothetical protein WCI59_13395 [Betaproteobacteria bacterium]|jgi:hypothetical protein